MPFIVFVDFIGGDTESSFNAFYGTTGLNYMSRALRINQKRSDGFAIRAPHKGLGGEMQNQIRLKLSDRLEKSIVVINIAIGGRCIFFQTRRAKN